MSLMQKLKAWYAKGNKEFQQLSLSEKLVRGGVVIALLFVYFGYKTIKNSNSTSSFEKTESSVIIKGPDDIALECRYKNTNSNDVTVLIYSPKYSIGKIGYISPDGSWDPKYKINNIQTNGGVIDFNITSYDWMIIKRMRPDANESNTVFSVYRDSLYATYRDDGGETHISSFFSYDCDLLDSSTFEKFVRQIQESSKKVKDSYKI